MLKNSQSRYGIVSISVHWLVAVTVFGLFGIGFWMVDLSYYSQWYRVAPYWHKSVGILLFFTMVVRLLWRFISPPPAPLSTHSPGEQRVAKAVQLVMYLAIFILAISGYLISTEDGRAIAVFDWFYVPALGALFDRQADIAGEIHKYAAYGLTALALLHAMAALKHHFIDKDATLRRMFRHKP